MTYMNENPGEYPMDTLKWNLNALSKAFKEVYPSATWIELIKFLDVDIDAREEFFFQSQDAFNIFMSLWTSLKPQNKSFPVEFLIANAWKNKRAQVTCLDYAISYSYTTFDILFEKAKRRQEPLNTLTNIKASSDTYLRIWKCIDLVQTLVNLSDSQHYFRVRQIFETPIKFTPEYLLLTLIKIKTKNGRFLQEDLYSNLLPSFLYGHANSIPILNEVWNADKRKIVVNSITELHKKNPKTMTLSRVLDICQAIKNSLLDILKISKDYEFSLQLAMLAAKRDFLHFDNWIHGLINQEGSPFIKSLFNYLENTLLKPAEDANEDERKIDKLMERSLITEGKLKDPEKNFYYLLIERLQMIFENLNKYKESYPERLDPASLKSLANLYTRFIKFFPSIQSKNHTNNAEIESRGNEYFQQLYKGEKEVDDLVEIMRDFRSSQDPTQREIYA